MKKNQKEMHQFAPPMILPQSQDKSPATNGKTMQAPKASPPSALPIGLLLSPASPPGVTLKLEGFNETSATNGKRKASARGREADQSCTIAPLNHQSSLSADPQLPPLISSPKGEDSSSPSTKELQHSEEDLKEGLSARFKDFFSEGLPVPSKPITSAVVCICNMFASEKLANIDLHKFATLLTGFATNGKKGILGVSYGDIAKGFQKKSSKQFAHQAQLRLRLDGADNVVVKMFKTGQMQTCGCPSVEISEKAVRMVVQALNDLLKDKDSDGLLKAQSHDVSDQIKTLNPDKLEVKVVNTNCSFDAGYSDKGYALNLQTLVSLLSKPEVADAVERVEFDPDSHYAGAKVYFKPSNYGEIQENGAAQRPVFVGVFPSSKCVITGAASNWIATQAYEFMSKFLVDKYEELREISLELIANRGMNQGNGSDSRPKKRRRKSAKALSNINIGALGLSANHPAVLGALKKETMAAAGQHKNGVNGQKATSNSKADKSSESKPQKKTTSSLEITLQLPDKVQPLVLRKAVSQSETLTDLRKWVAAQASKHLEGRPEWLRSLAFVGGYDKIVGQDDEYRTAAVGLMPQVRLAQLEVAQAAEALLLGLRS